MQYPPYGSFDEERRRNAGFQVGLVSGAIMVCVHLILLFINGWTNQGDFLAWVIAWFVYFLAARVAAQQQYDGQRDTLEPLRGVQGAGVGAALITSVVVWIFIIIRGVVRDAVGITILVEPVSLYCIAVIDGLIALGLGSWGGRAVANKYKTFDNY